MSYVLQIIAFLIFVQANFTESLSSSSPYDALYSENLTVLEYRRHLGEITKNFIGFRSEPCDNFYKFACGKFTLNSALTEMSSRHTSSVREIFEKYNEKSTMFKGNYVFPEEEDSSSNKPFEISNGEKNALRFYASCMAGAKTKPKPSDAASDFLKSWNGYPFEEKAQEDITTKFEWLNMTAHARSYGFDIIFSEQIAYGDWDDLTDNFGILFEVDTSIAHQTFRKNTTGCITYDNLKIKKPLEYVKVPDNYLQKIIDDVIFIDQKLNSIYERNRSDAATRTVGEWKVHLPEIDLQSYLNVVLNGVLEINLEQKVKVRNIEVIRKISKMLHTEDLERKLRNYLFFQLALNLYDKNSKKSAHSCLSETKNLLSVPVNALFLREHFSNAIQKQTIEIANYIKEGFVSFINESNWINSTSKEVFITKALQSTVNVGYFKQYNFTQRLFGDYSELNIESDKWFENSIQLYKLANKEEQRVLVFQEYETDSLVFNAFYDPAVNALMIPAAFLVPPIYDEKSPAWAAFGGLGTVLGHELNHGFDLSSFLYDSKHKLHSKSDIDLQTYVAYFSKAVCLARQYNSFGDRLYGEHVDGVATIGENIADNAGTKVAFRAYNSWLKANPDKVGAEKVDNLELSPLQLFFVNYAQLWCEKTTRISQTDEHSPAMFRVLGTLSNSNEFAVTYNCTIGSRMHPARKCNL